MLFILLLFLPGRVVAQPYSSDTLSLKVYFPINESSVDYTFGGNGARIREFVRGWNAIKDQSRVQEVVVIGSASPEGPKAFNRRIAEERARHLGRHIAHLTGLQESQFLYDIQDNTGAPIADDQWEQYRHAGVLTVVLATREQETKPETEAQSELQPEAQAGSLAATAVGAATVATTTHTQTQEQTQQPTKEKFSPFALRTNLLLPALNIGIEVPLGDRWSVGADWYYPWLWRPKHAEGVDYPGWCVEALALNIEGRYWFGKRSPEKRLLGHSAGLFAMAGYYDFERNYKGLQGEFATVGVDYLFAMPVFKKRMHLEFCLGIGYFYSQARQYEVYTPGGKGYKEKDMAKVIQYFGPVKATVSLVWPIYFTKKGGAK